MGQIEVTYGILGSLFFVGSASLLVTPRRIANQGRFAGIVLRLPTQPLIVLKSGVVICVEVGVIWRGHAPRCLALVGLMACQDKVTQLRRGALSLKEKPPMRRLLGVANRAVTLGGFGPGSRHSSEG